jgi:23S rRNA (adenine-N6)-dimethyltransferase
VRGARRRPHRRRGSPPNPTGAHALADHAAARLVHDAAITAGDLVLDIGAGLGAITRPLARTGARVIAIERDPRIAGSLARRASTWPRVTVVTGDGLAVPLPHRPFRVVANIPFAITTDLLRRLVDSRMSAADLVVEMSAARRLAGEPMRPELARWHRRFEFTLVGVLPARLFRPAPPVNAAVLRLRRVGRR